MAGSRGFQRLARNSVFFESNIVYVGHYKELDRTNTIKIGHSKDILERIKKADYHGRMAMGYLLALPTESLMRGTEQGIKAFIQSKNIGAHGKEYVCPVKFSRLFNLTKPWDAEEGVHAMTCLVIEALSDRSIQVVRVVQEPDDDSGSEDCNSTDEPSSVQQGGYNMPVGFPANTVFELLPSEFDFALPFRNLLRFLSVRNEFKECVIREQDQWKRRRVLDDWKRADKDVELKRLEASVKQKDMEHETNKTQLEIHRLDREIVHDIIKAGIENGKEMLTMLVGAYEQMVYRNPATKRKYDPEECLEEGTAASEGQQDPHIFQEQTPSSRTVVDTDIYRSFVNSQFRFVGKGRGGLPMEVVKQTFETWCSDPSRNLSLWFESKDWETQHLSKLTDEFWRDRADKPVGGRWELTHYGSRRRLEGFSGWELVQYVSCKID